MVNAGRPEAATTPVVASSAAPRRRAFPWEWTLLGAALLLGAVVPLGLAAITGSLVIPHNDAWSYSRIAQEFARTGQIHLLGWNRTALFGQFLVLGPLARWLAVQQAFVAALSAVTLVAAYHLLTAHVGRRRAAFAVLVIAVWPGFGLLATTFMTDVPTMAAMMLCLALGQRALRRRSVGLLGCSLGFGVWGVTIREQALAAPAAVLLVAGLTSWRTRGGYRWRTLLGAAAGVLACVAAFELWRRSYGAGDAPVVATPPDLANATSITLRQGYFILALGLMPVVVLATRPSRWRRDAAMVAGIAAAVAVASVHDWHASGFFVGNYLDPAGPYWKAGNGHPSALFPGSVWRIIVAGACLSGVLMAGTLARRLPKLDPLLGTYLLLMAAGNVVVSISGQGNFDRYCLLLMPPLLAALLSEPAAGSRRISVLPAAVACAGLAALSLTITAAGVAYDTARWNTAEQLVATGIPARAVDAGLEWNGYHSAIGMVPDSSWSFPGSRQCFTITATPRPDRTPLRVVTYRTIAVAGNSPLWIYRDRRPECR